MVSRLSAFFLTLSLGLTACGPSDDPVAEVPLDAAEAASQFQLGRGQQLRQASQPSQETLDKAIHHLEEAARLDATRAEHHFYAGVAREARGDHAEARAHFEAAVVRDATHAEAHWRLGTLQHGDGELARARTNLERARELGVGDDQSALLVDLGRVLEDLSELEEAEARYREATDLSAHETQAWFRLAHLLAERGVTAEAEQANRRYEHLWSLEQEYAGLREAVRADSRNPAAQVALAMAAQRLGRADVARRACEAALQVAPGYGPATELLAALGDGR